MVNFYLVPKWFLGYDVLLELFFAIILLSIAIFAYKAYKNTDLRSLKLFSTSFFLISLSYITQSIFNFLIFSDENANLPRRLLFEKMIILNSYAFLSHIILMIIGLGTLLYMTLKKKDLVLLSFIYIMSLITIIMSSNLTLTYYIISTIYLLFIEVHFAKNFFLHKQKNALLIFFAFFLVLIANIYFVLSLNSKIFYIVAHALLSIAYTLILINFILIRKK